MFLEEVAINNRNQRGDYLRHRCVDATPLHKQFQADIVDCQRAEGGYKVAYAANLVAQRRAYKRHSALEPIAREECNGEGDTKRCNMSRDIYNAKIEIVETQHHVVEQRIEQPIENQIGPTARRITEGLHGQYLTNGFDVEKVYNLGYPVC